MTASHGCHGLLLVHLTLAMVPQAPARMTVEPSRRPFVATFYTCAHPERAHAFSLQKGWEVEHVVARAASKLGFEPAQLVAIAPPSAPAAASEGERCVCGLFSKLDSPLELAELDQRLALHITAPAVDEGVPSSPLAVLRPRTAPEPGKRGVRQSPGELRLKVQALWVALDQAKVYVPPLEVEKVTGKFDLERHGHGRGNTKSTKKRQKRQDRSDLSQNPCSLGHRDLAQVVCYCIWSSWPWTMASSFQVM